MTIEQTIRAVLLPTLRSAGDTLTYDEAVRISITTCMMMLDAPAEKSPGGWSEWQIGEVVAAAENCAEHLEMIASTLRDQWKSLEGLRLDLQRTRER